MSEEFLLGVAGTGSVIIALFFLRYWRSTGDRFFALFSLAFAMFAANRILLSFLEEGSDARPGAYTIRLLAFLIIIAAIVDKNRSST